MNQYPFGNTIPFAPAPKGEKTNLPVHQFPIGKPQSKQITNTQ
jgi:hypothetical protein